MATNGGTVEARVAADLADILIPQHDFLIVRRDPESRQIGRLFAPDNAQLQPCLSGTVLRCGPSAPFGEGERVAFGRYAMRVLRRATAEAGDDSCDVGLLASSEVLCTFAATEEELPVPLADAGAPYAVPPAGRMLVERHETATMGRLLIPDTFTSSVRSLEATVVSSGHPDYEPGDVVLLSPNVGKHVPFGITGARTLYLVTHDQVVARIAPQASVGDLPLPEDSLLQFRGPIRQPDDLRWDEGDPKAPQ